MKELLILTFLLIGLYALDWAFTIGAIYLICLCFSWEFNLLIATGIWFIMEILKGIFSGRGGK